METVEVQADGSESLVMYRECPFCGRRHRSPYVDELEAAVMACRDRLTPKYRGSLEAWDMRDTLPIPPEVEAYVDAPGMTRQT